MDIEKEVQARVEFKMNELLTAIKNNAENYWTIAFNTGNPKYEHYWEAFGFFKTQLEKETKMQPPCNEMAERKRIEKRNAAIEQIVSRICKRGQSDYHQNERFVASVIEKLSRD